MASGIFAKLLDSIKPKPVTSAQEQVNHTGVRSAAEMSTLATVGSSTPYQDPVPGFAPYHWAGYWGYAQAVTKDDARTNPEPMAEQGVRLDHYREPDPLQPNLYPPYNGATQQAFSQTDQHGTPEPTVQVRVPQAPDPRWDPPDPSRTIWRDSNYVFLRAWDVGAGRPDLNGNHYSQAELLFPMKIGGMEPTGDAAGLRNTYRITPPPSDINIVDRGTDPSIPVRSAQFDVNYNGYGRSYRLGG